MRQRHVLLPALVLVLVTAACGADTGSEANDGASPSTSEATTSTTTTTTTFPVTLQPSPSTKPAPPPSDVPIPEFPTGQDPADFPQVVFAIADLSTLVGADASEIVVLGWEEVVWRDGALGCPQPGFAYTQALVDGVRIALEHDGRIYWYHARGSGEPFWCESPDL